MAGKSPREAAKARAKSRQASASKKKRTHSFTVTVTSPDLASAKKKINNVAGAVVKGQKERTVAAGSKVASVGKRAVDTVKGDLASGRGRRDAKMRATGTKADASAELAQRKKQKATRGRIAARRRKQSGAGGG